MKLVISKKQKLFYALEYLMTALLLGKLFYGTFFAGLAGLVLIPFLLKKKQQELLEKKRHILLLQFKEMTTSFANALRAGYSPENAVSEAYDELLYIYDKDEMIMTELRDMIGKLKNKHSLDELMLDLGQRSGLEDIKSFAAVFSVAKRSGGNLVTILTDTAARISEKITVTEEISLMYAEKRFEQKIMDVLPVAIMLYIGFTNPGYFDPLYKNAAGIAIMTVCLIIYGTAYLISCRIMDIRI
ncbi:MAG: type II secretion system F family protein [Lachnospiraceae bacterium]|nr:type II secretion system F family protein [Lachnospiraceae bacterium]